MTDQTSDLRPQPSGQTRPRVLALSSTGGHWIQMLRLQPAFEGCDVTYATTNTDYQSDIENHLFRTIIDANRTQKFKLLLSALSILWTIISVWPDVILSTGAAPGFFAIRIGKLFGKKTIWVDSIANAEELSVSGHRVAKFADLWLTQWEHLAKPEGPHHYGNVLGEASEEQSSEGGNRKLEVSSHSSKTLHSPSATHDQTSGLRSQKSFRIFVTVGSDVPFDRMVKVIDQWASQNPNHHIFAQIGLTSWKPKTFAYCQFLTPVKYTQHVTEADLIIAHAGIGSIITALKYQKSILVMPRRGYLGEALNEHQVATAEKLQEKCKLAIAFNEDELADKLDTLSTHTFSKKMNLTVSKLLNRKISDLLSRPALQFPR